MLNNSKMLAIMPNSGAGKKDNMANLLRWELGNGVVYFRG
jgi:hypothetical protein